MNNSREAQQALEALGKWSSGRDMGAVELNDLIAALEAALGQPEPQEIADLRQACREGWRYADELEQERKRLTAALAALEQPEQEPVAWLDEEINCAYTPAELDGGTADGLVPLYTAPHQRKPLIAVDLRALYDQHAAYQEEGPETSGWWDFARAIEQAHGIVSE
jgi:hypothetical protein